MLNMLRFQRSVVVSIAEAESKSTFHLVCLFVCLFFFKQIFFNFVIPFPPEPRKMVQFQSACALLKKKKIIL